MANIEALHQLIRVLESTPDDRFDILYWSTPTECGTVCCALGWAARDRYFNDLGLHMEGHRLLSEPRFGLFGGYWAGSELFEITPSQSEEIFRGIRYIVDGWDDRLHTGRTSVIARIRHLIDHHTLQRDQHVCDHRRMVDRAGCLLDNLLQTRGVTV